MDASVSAARSLRADKPKKRSAEKSAATRTPSPAQEASPSNESREIAAGVSAAAKAIRRLDWHPSAPATVLAAAAENDPARVWKAWRRDLCESRPKPLAKLFGIEKSPLAWSLPVAADERNTAMLVELTAANDRATRKRLAGGATWNDITARWLAESRDADAGHAHAVEALAWCHALVWLADELSPEVWCGLFEHLVSVAVDAAAISLTADPLANQLYAGELPLALAYRFPQIKNTRAMLKPARRALSRGLVDLLNGEGMPTWADLAIARPMLACWTRCAAIGRELSAAHGKYRGCWNAAAGEQFRHFVLASLRLIRRDGSQMLIADGSQAAAAPGHDLFAAAIALSGNKRARRVAEIVLPQAAPMANRDRRRKSGKKLPKSSYHCEWSGVSLLRPRWRRGGTRLALAFGAQHVQLELCCGRDVVLCGPWSAEVTLDGRRLEPVGAWEESCWITNKWADYVELQLPLADGVTLQRHVVLPREDGFLMLADAVVGKESGVGGQESGVVGRGSGEDSGFGIRDSGFGIQGESSTLQPTAFSLQPRIAYRGTIPLGSDIKFAAEAETRETILRGSRDRALVMPLALPEWRSDPRVGLFAAADGALELRQSNPGASLVAPLWFDLRRKRFTRQRTWRQLTVAEDRRIQPPDRAVGYRVHSGDEQWIVYRSLTPRGNRTFLGHNLSTEFLVARFEVDGGTANVDPLVEIE